MGEKRVARGVWQTENGWRVHVYKTTPPQSKRLPASMTLKEVKQWRQAWEVDLLRGVEPALDAEPGGFADEVRNDYLPAVAAMPTFKTRQQHLEEWIELFGNRLRRTIRPHEIAAQRDRWLTVGPRREQRKSAEGKVRWVRVEGPLSASATNQRLRALSNVFTMLDGPKAYNPVREIEEAEPAPEQARGMPYEMVRAILAAMPDVGRADKGKDRPPISKTKARLMVMAWTGLSPAEMSRLQPRDVNLPHRTIAVPPRRKGRRGRGGRARPMVTKPLSTEGVAALQAFIEAECWGPFSTSSARQSFLRACAAAGYTDVALRPYDLRHSFATAVYAADGDLGATQDMMNHADSRTTRRYARAAVNQRAVQAMAKFEAATARKPPAKPPASA